MEFAFIEYRAGTTDYTTVTFAQETALSNEEAEPQIENNQFKEGVAPLRALGGGWVGLP